MTRLGLAQLANGLNDHLASHKSEDGERDDARSGDGLHADRRPGEARRVTRLGLAQLANGLNDHLASHKSEDGERDDARITLDVTRDERTAHVTKGSQGLLWDVARDLAPLLIPNRFLVLRFACRLYDAYWERRRLCGLAYWGCGSLAPRTARANASI